MESEVADTGLQTFRDDKINTIVSIAGELCDADADTLIDFARRLMIAHTQEVSQY